MELSGSCSVADMPAPCIETVTPVQYACIWTSRLECLYTAAFALISQGMRHSPALCKIPGEASSHNMIRRKTMVF